MTKLFLIATTMLSLATAPALAREARPAAGTASGGSDTSEQRTAAPSARPGQKYCTIDQITGTRIPIKTCKTRGEWLQLGFDPLAAK